MFSCLLKSNDFLVTGAYSFLTSALIVILLGKPFIKLVSKYLQPIRKEGIKAHFNKSNTPIFGGVLVIFGFIISCILWVKFNELVLAVIVSGLLFGFLGIMDDIIKLKNKSSKGLGVKFRLISGLVIGFMVAYLIVDYNTQSNLASAHSIYFPFKIFSLKGFYISVGGFIYMWMAVIVLGSANAVNLTDGLDGLASIICITLLMVFAIFIYKVSAYGGMNNHFFMLDVSHNSATIYNQAFIEIYILIMALAGALVGFLWYNTFPAQIFMGEVGSLFLGGTMGGIALALKIEFILAIAGIILILEVMSVIIQVGSYKLRRKRVFLMAPLHHHYEKKGIPETKVVFRFWMVTVVMSLITLLLVLN